MIIPEVVMGYICPDWARKSWVPESATIAPSLRGTFTVVCPTTQCSVFVGKTHDECEAFRTQSIFNSDVAQGKDPALERIKTDLEVRKPKRIEITLGDMFPADFRLT